MTVEVSYSEASREVDWNELLTSERWKWVLISSVEKYGPSKT